MAPEPATGRARPGAASIGRPAPGPSTWWPEGTEAWNFLLQSLWKFHSGAAMLANSMVSPPARIARQGWQKSRTMRSGREALHARAARKIAFPAVTLAVAGDDGARNATGIGNTIRSGKDAGL